MELYGWAAVIVAGIGALTWILVTALKKIPAVCREARKAVRAVRELRDEIRGPKPSDSVRQSVDERLS
ncbi:hypothetical protein [Streptomyces silvensis]|uniref:hypothetical protein n=1 Tax=Streptomyces silvensis TaxID=1765722 RepID=UPI001A7E08C0|nr:hypothetical protein [Streptomyces silvensis]